MDYDIDFQLLHETVEIKIMHKNILLSLKTNKTYYFPNFFVLIRIPVKTSMMPTRW
jgi:hypothetical protein